MVLFVCTISILCSPGCKRPSGGSGGKGGNVYLLADPSINSLKMQTFHYSGGTGRHGGSMLNQYVVFCLMLYQVLV